MLQPTHTNPAQKFLYNQGAKDIHPDFVGLLKPHEVRRRGVNRMTRRAAGAALLAAGLTVTGAFFGDSFDRSPTQKHYVETVTAQEEEKAQADQQLEPAVEGVSLPGEVTPVSGEGQMDPTVTPIGQERNPAIEAEVGSDVAPRQ